MNIKAAAIAGALGLAGGLTACTPVDKGFGDSFRTNLAAQTIDPDPAREGTEASFSGQKAASASERHRTGKTKPPRGIRTTTAISGGGAAAAGSSGQ